MGSYESDSSMESNENDSFDGENAEPEPECELWLNINYQMDCENFLAMQEQEEAGVLLCIIWDVI